MQSRRAGKRGLVATLMVRSAKRVSNHESPGVAILRDAAPRLLRMRWSGLLPLRKCLLDHELRRLAVVAFDKALAVEQSAGVGHQRRAAADHDAVVDGIERGEANVAEQLA